MNIKHRKTFLRNLVILLLLLSANAWAINALGSPTLATPNKSLATTAQTTQPHLYPVKIEHGQRRTVSGTIRSYALYIPQLNSSLPGPPYPLVVMVHGFLMSSNEQKYNAQFLAQRGLIVLCPNMTKILLGSKIRDENVLDVVDQTKWLIEQSKLPTSPCYKLLDAKRTAIAGNSSGGAVCFEAALEAQKQKIPFQAMCTMEGVPWDRTLDKVSALEPLQLLTLRAEPCLCNFHSNILKYVERLKFPADDIKINGAHHCDAENPTSLGCMSVCGTSHEKYRRLFQLVTYLYLKEVLKAPQMDGFNKSFIEEMEGMQKEGKVTAHLNNLQSRQIK